MRQIGETKSTGRGSRVAVISSLVIHGSLAVLVAILMLMQTDVREILEQAAALVEVNPTFRALAQDFWPGGLTIVAPARPLQPTAILAPDGTIGLRMPGSASIRRLIEAAGCPIVGTSANRTGERPLSDAASAFEEFGDEVDYILAGRSAGATASTVVNVAHDPARVLRVGAILPAKLQET